MKSLFLQTGVTLTTLSGAALGYKIGGSAGLLLGASVGIWAGKKISYDHCDEKTKKIVNVSQKFFLTLLIGCSIYQTPDYCPLISSSFACQALTNIQLIANRVLLGYGINQFVDSFLDIFSKDLTVVKQSLFPFISGITFGYLGLNFGGFFSAILGGYSGITLAKNFSKEKLIPKTERMINIAQRILSILGAGYCFYQLQNYDHSNVCNDWSCQVFEKAMPWAQHFFLGCGIFQGMYTVFDISGENHSLIKKIITPLIAGLIGGGLTTNLGGGYVPGLLGAYGAMRLTQNVLVDRSDSQARLIFNIFQKNLLAAALFCFAFPNHLKRENIVTQNLEAIAKWIFLPLAACKIYDSYKDYYYRDVLIQRWIVGDRTFECIQNGKSITAKIKDSYSNRLLAISDIPCSPNELKGKIEELKSSIVVLKPNGQLLFKHPLFVWDNHPRYSVALIKIENTFLLYIHDKYTQIGGYSGFNPRACKIPSNATESTKALANQFSQNISETFYEGWNTVAIEEVTDLSRAIKTENLPPISYRVNFMCHTTHSRIDKRFTLSANCWGVTMVWGRDDRSCNLHSMLVFEGIENGEYFMCIGELNGTNKILFSKVSPNKSQYKLLHRSEKKRFNCSPEELDFISRTCVFKRPRQAVKEVMNKIRAKAVNCVPNPPPATFSEYGRRALINSSGYPNCCDFVIDHLEMLGIFLERSRMDHAAGIGVFYTSVKKAFENNPYPEEDWKKMIKIKEDEI